MSYFSMFPELQYDAKGNGVVNLQKDIFRRVKVKAPLNQALLTLTTTMCKTVKHQK